MEFRLIPSLNYKYEINEDGTIFRNAETKRENKIVLDMHHSKKGYYKTMIHIGGRGSGNYTKRIMIHRVVAECWLGPCPENMEVDHIDRNSKNNHYTNLRYVSKSEQMKNRDHKRISKKGAMNLEEARKKRMIKVSIQGNGITKDFESKAECARFLSELLSITTDAVRNHLKQNKKYYKGYSISYIK